MFQPGFLYHDLSRLGLSDPQRPGPMGPNQEASEPLIAGYTALAIAKLKNRSVPEISFAELFCADGYYAMVARRLGAHRVCGYDNNREGFFPKAEEVRARLGFDGVEFRLMDVQQIPEDHRYSIVANVGGLHHVPDPVEVLLKSARMAERYLIVQTVVSLAVSDESYFAAPAPGWTWGCRFSRQSFEKLIRELGLKVLDCEFNCLPGNTRPEDSGSLYYLIDTEASRPVQVPVPVLQNYRDLSPGSDHYRAFVGPPRQYDLVGAGQFRLLTALGLREHHTLLDFGCGSLRAGRLLIPYLGAGNYFGVEPNRWLIEDAFRFDLGQDLRDLKAPRFSHNDDFSIPFGERRFDYILAQSIFTHTGPDLARRLFSAIEGALAPSGMAVASFVNVDDVAEDASRLGWRYPECVGFTHAGIDRLAASAGLEAHRLPWYAPRVTWFLLTRPGECRLSEVQRELVRGPVLFEPDFATSLVPPNGCIASVNGREALVAGAAYPLHGEGFGYVDLVEDRGASISIHGWALDTETRKPAVFVAAAYLDRLLKTIDYAAVERSDVSDYLGLSGGVAAGFAILVAKPAELGPPGLRVMAVFAGHALELPGVHRQKSAAEL